MLFYLVSGATASRTRQCFGFVVSGHTSHGSNNDTHPEGFVEEHVI